MKSLELARASEMVQSNSFLIFFFFLVRGWGGVDTAVEASYVEEKKWRRLRWGRVGVMHGNLELYPGGGHHPNPSTSGWDTSLEYSD